MDKAEEIKSLAEIAADTLAKHICHASPAVATGNATGQCI